MPDYVFCLEANDEFLRNRVMNLPESVVHGTHNDEEGLMKRLELYRSLNNDEETVLNYFDEKEFHPEKLDVTKDDSPMMRDTVEKIKKTIGEPRNYGRKQPLSTMWIIYRYITRTFFKSGYTCVCTSKKNSWGG